MERDYWNQDRYRNEHNRWRGDDRRRADEDSYRGAYRLDTTSDHRNETTWDGYGSTERDSRRHNDYSQNYNRDYNEDSRNRGYDHDNYNTDSRYRDQGNKNYRSSNYADWNDQGRYGNDDDYGHRQGNQRHRSVHDRIQDRDPYGASNFNADYRPDHYGQGGGENYGNQAGSLSFGYDGGRNSDPDWARHYDPLSGKRRSYHGDYTSRRPQRDRHRDDPGRH